MTSRHMGGRELWRMEGKHRVSEEARLGSAQHPEEKDERKIQRQADPTEPCGCS